jgi:hypothetical protein
MRRNLFWLSDEQWERIEPHLPTDVRGVERADDRRVISGIVHVLKTGCRWCDCPPEYGPPTTIYNRFVRWAERGIWENLSRPSVSATGAAPASNWPLGQSQCIPQADPGAAIVHARSRYRALAALDLGKLAHQLPPAAVQIVLDRFALHGHAIAVHCAVQRYR